MTACPFCKREVAAPSLSEAISTYGLVGHEAAVLEAVWRGRGLPVQTSPLFDAMYADDPNGGPSPTRMYRQLHDALVRLREKLKRSGIAIKSAGYRKGYRLSLR